MNAVHVPEYILSKVFSQVRHRVNHRVPAHRKYEKLVNDLLDCLEDSDL